jgi:hypothetical protein
MGKRNTTAQQQETLAWAKAYQGHRTRLGAGTVPRAAAVASGDQLRRYFALAALSRSTTAPQGLVEAAWNEVFRVRVAIEHSIDRSVCDSLTNGAITLREILGGGFFGVSKKQGVSVRMPLLTCRPTRICGAACYAHDVLDAAPAAVVRGVLNGIIARTYEEGTAETRRGVIDKLQPQTRRVVQEAIKEVARLSSWTRPAYVRFSHVGEIVAFPQFANALAAQVRAMSAGRVACVVYSRHPMSRELEPELFVINFTLDSSSLNRRSLAPPTARIVFSAFGGEVRDDVDINFVEHHRWTHVEPVGQGRICPATMPRVDERTCDAVGCARCFSRPDADSRT